MTYKHFALAAVVTLLLTACGQSADTEQTAPGPTRTSVLSNAAVTAPKSTELPNPTTVLAPQPTTRPAEPTSVATEVTQPEPEPKTTSAPSNAPMTAPVSTEVLAPTTDPATQATTEPTAVAAAIPEEDVEPQAKAFNSAYSHAEDGVASYLSDVLHGAATTSGAIYNKDEYVAAHKDLPFGTKVLVTNLHNGKSVTVTVIDRMPYNNPHLIDVSSVAAVELEMLSAGNIEARIQWNE